jgi:uncharacterized membrane protein YgcG
MELILILLIVVGAIMFMQSRQNTAQVGSSRQNKELADRRWQAVRRVAEEDVTQLGQQIAGTPVPASLEPEAAHDFDDALASYERAKEALAASAHPDDLQWVSKSLDDGRFALAKLDARREGRDLPSRRPPCFFDQRHGLSVSDAQWAPAGGAMRDVPVCAACGARIADGLDPEARLVPTAAGDRPYYDAGPEYAPWARGWYAGSGAYMMSNVLMGTMLFNALYLPPGYNYFGADGGAAGDAGGDAGDAGGDAGGDGGGDFGGGDMGGGGFDGGGFDFGGF